MIRIMICALAVAVPVATPVLAQSQEETPIWSLEATVGGVSDYRYRGYSLSDEEPALQGGATLTHRSGFYADGYLSTIDEYGVGDDGDGSRLEVTATLGWAGTVADFDVNASVAAYRYPDGDDVDYVEVPVQVGKTVGAATWTVGVAYAPAQNALGDEDNRYGWAAIDLAPSGWPVSLTGSIGYEDGAFAPGGKTDWSVGASRTFGPATLGLTWVDSDEYDGQLVASVFFGF